MSKRKDAIGFFWEDLPPEKKEAKVKVRRTPPEPFWLDPDYLPNLEVAQAFVPDLFNDMELWAAQQNKERLVLDAEVYPNYVCFGFKSIDSGKVVFFEKGLDSAPADLNKFAWIMKNFTIVTFNGRKYDEIILELFLHGYGPEEMWDATVMVIQEELRFKDVRKKYKTTRIEFDHIDLIELTALAPGLKVCAGRLHAPRLQDLPFPPGTILTSAQIVILRWYNINDLDNTIILYKSLLPQIQIRESQGKRYGLDLRSHSDAQMAEAIIASEVRKRKGVKHLKKAELKPGTWYTYKAPAYIKFQTPLLNHVLNTIQGAYFHIHPVTGEVVMPDEIKGLVIRMNKSQYQIGIGGLHSQEKSVAHVTDDEYLVIDTDVTSYYPYLILNAGIAPENLGADFLHVYRNIVEERVRAKAAGQTQIAECLKIVVNGSFGKLGSIWSVLYAPNLMLQVTITGQLSILMLAETFELNGIEVTSVNTDGIVVKCHRSKEALFHSIVKEWERQTGLSTEETRYAATYSKDINNYIAVYAEKQKGKLFKTKGVYAETSSKKNAVNEICVTAVKAYLEYGTPPATTIRACRDIRQFTSMRAVNKGKGDPRVSGAVKGNEYLGKLIRWYYAIGEQGEIVNAKSGNKVSRTDGAKPLMNLPAEFPDDVNYEWYIDETYKMLEDIGYAAKGSYAKSKEAEEEEEEEEESA